MVGNKGTDQKEEDVKGEYRRAIYIVPVHNGQEWETNEKSN